MFSLPKKVEKEADLVEAVVFEKALRAHTYTWMCVYACIYVRTTRDAWKSAAVVVVDGSVQRSGRWDDEGGEKNVYLHINICMHSSIYFVYIRAWRENKKRFIHFIWDRYRVRLRGFLIHSSSRCYCCCTRCYLVSPPSGLKCHFPLCRVFINETAGLITHWDTKTLFVRPRKYFCFRN